MISTYLVELDMMDRKGQRSSIIVETTLGRTKADVVDWIIQNQYEDSLHKIYRVALDQVTEDVTDEVAREVWEYGINHDLPRDVINWLEWAGYTYDEEAA